ncbi:N-acetyltransferase [Brevibacillus brevis]|uniref:N-acetyltransferase n=1 Tax=Brevibacillus brevis TaxID=1393 RepID=UPI0025A5EAED|nr:N-acetyltransferase [Brevibacillus brevis]WJQ82402.1 N-acetyltransferase [Brevibacillus brevis]
MNIRRGKGQEASELSELAYRSKAYWGYSDEFMKACRDDLTLSSAYIETQEVYVLEDEGSIKGFMSLEKDAEQEQWLLGYLFMEPEAVGKVTERLCGSIWWRWHKSWISQSSPSTATRTQNRFTCREGQSA